MGQYSDPILLEAALSDSAAAPIAGVELTFQLLGEDTDRTFTATTDDEGIGRVNPVLTERPGEYEDDDLVARARLVDLVSPFNYL